MTDKQRLGALCACAMRSVQYKRRTVSPYNHHQLYTASKSKPFVICKGQLFLLRQSDHEYKLRPRAPGPDSHTSGHVLSSAVGRGQGTRVWSPASSVRLDRILLHLIAICRLSAAVALLAASYTSVLFLR